MSPGDPSSPALDPVVRALLVCPRCRGELLDVEQGLVCRPCALRYPVVDGIPRMVEALAKKIR